MNTLLWLVAALGVVCIVLAVLLTACIYGWWKAEQECKQTRVKYWDEHDGRAKAEDKLLTVQSQRDKINTERDILSRECRKSEDAIAFYVGELQQCQIERDKWKGLYNDLLATYHDAQGDALTMEVAPDPPKRTRKKAGA